MYKIHKTIRQSGFGERFFSWCEQHYKLVLRILILTGLGLRVFVSFFTDLPLMHRDSIEYFNQADAILAGGYTNFFPNGYPFLIALVKMISASNAQMILAGLNVSGSTCVIYFAYVISLKLFSSQRIALCTALLLAIFPSQINYVRWLTTETPSAFLLFGAFYFLILKKNWISGLFFGIAIVFRTEFMPVWLIISAVYLFSERRRSVKLFFGGLLPVVLVASYCYTKTGEFSLAGHGTVNILISATASGHHIEWDAADQHPELNTTPKAIDYYFRNFKDAPFKFLGSRVANFWELWGFYPASDENRSVLSKLLLGLGNFLMIVFGGWGFWKSRKIKYAILMAIPFIVITATHVVFFAISRYTCPAEPFMIVFSGVSVMGLFNRLELRNVLS